MNLYLPRREFLAGASAFALAGCLAPGGALAGAPRLKFGVISDIHITDWASTDCLRKAFRHFDREGVDAVMIVGDFADHGLLCQLENVARAWESVFPDDTGFDGRHVEKLFVSGNHDPDGLQYRDEPMDRAFLVHNLTYEEAAKRTLKALGFGKCWENCFHEEYKPIFRKNVRGYEFIGGHWDTWKGIRGLGDWWKENVKSVDPSKPFFYFQHPHPAGTIYENEAWGSDAGQSTRILSRYRNAVAFSGHSHFPLLDGRSYWRGEFTSIGTGSLSYSCLMKGRENRYSFRNKLDGREGQIVSVYDDRMVIVRRDFAMDEDLDEALVFELPAAPSTFSVRAIRPENVPEFAKGAKLDAAVKGGKVNLTLPAAFAKPTARLYDYAVTFVGKWKDSEGKAKSKKIEKLWYPNEVTRTRRRAEKAQLVRAELRLSDLGASVETVDITVVPRNCYGGKGAPLKASVKV